MNTYDKRDPLTYCGWCMKEAGVYPPSGSSTGICGRHAGDVLGEVQRQFPVPLTREEWALRNQGLKRFLDSPEVATAKVRAEELRTCWAELERARKASRRKRRLLLALWILAGCVLAAMGICVQFYVSLLLSK